VTGAGDTRAQGAPSPDDTHAQDSLAVIRQRCDVVPDVAIVLGSGLAPAADDVEACHEFAYQDLPGFPPPSVPGHPGRLRLGELSGVPVAVFLGRVHLSEGHGMAATTLVSRLAAALGARTLVLTNAAGGLDDSVRPGDLMLITDHLNFQGQGVLAGWRWPDGRPAFVDLSCVYDPGLRSAAEAAAAAEGIETRSGVYVAVSGPAYETPAETRFLAGAGARAVGMSTVPEAAAGVALGMRVVGFSCIANMAGTPASHEEVLATAKKGGAELRSIFRRLIPNAVRGSS
jgi:purine-nucleoside phosphorylase